MRIVLTLQRCKIGLVRATHLIVVAVLLLFIINGPASAAEDGCTLKPIYTETAYYSTCLDIELGACSESGPLTGADNEERIWNFFAGKGLKPVAIAGIMGNFEQENSFFDPARKQDDTIKAIPDKGDGITGYGIAQWTTRGRQALLFDKIRGAGLQQYYGEGWGSAEKDKDIPAGDIDKLLSIELEFAWSGDTTKIKDMADRLNNAPSTDNKSGSTYIFHELYEPSGDDISEIKDRMTSAAAILQKYNGTGVFSSGSCSTGQLGGVKNTEDVVPWAMKFIEDTKAEYNGAPKATASLIKNRTEINASGGTIMSIATFPDASTEFVCWRAYGCDECTTLTGWFVTKMTNYTYGGGNGEKVVEYLGAKGVPTGTTPKPFSIFSYDTGEFGHTGIVMGVMDDGSVITLENNWPSDTLSVRRYNIKADYPEVQFAYVADKLKDKSVLTTQL